MAPNTSKDHPLSNKPKKGINRKVKKDIQPRRQETRSMTTEQRDARLKELGTNRDYRFYNADETFRMKYDFLKIRQQVLENWDLAHKEGLRGPRPDDLATEGDDIKAPPKNVTDRLA